MAADLATARVFLVFLVAVIPAHAVHYAPLFDHSRETDVHKSLGTYLGIVSAFYRMGVIEDCSPRHRLAMRGKRPFETLARNGRGTNRTFKSLARRSWHKGGELSQAV